MNFNYQVFSVCNLPILASTSTPTFDSELGIEIDTVAVTIIPEIPEHSFYLMQWVRIGVSEVHLLLGIKNTNLNPVWIKTLPSGQAVYQSVFKDIWGSDLIFAGPIKRSLMVTR